VKPLRRTGGVGQDRASVDLTRHAGGARPGRPTRRSVVLAMALGALAMAPTPGDIGGCGQPAEELKNVELFFRAMDAADCAACERCGLATKSCARACEGEPGLAPTFPEGCVPLVHDGEVCLRRLQEDDCEAYRVYVADDGAGEAVPLVSRPRPAECQFCPERLP
jgi:hypothetical protein